MINNNNGVGGKTPRPDEGDETDVRRKKYIRRKGGNGGKQDFQPEEEELVDKLKQPVVNAGSFEEQLAAKRAALGLPALDLSNISPEPELSVSEELPVESAEILPVEVPSFDNILAAIESKEKISKSNSLLERLNKDFDLPEDLSLLLEKFLAQKKVKSLERFESNLQLVLTTFKQYSKNYDLSEKEKYNFLDLIFDAMSGDEPYADSSIRLAMSVILSDLRLYKEVEIYLAQQAELASSEIIEESEGEPLSSKEEEILETFKNKVPEAKPESVSVDDNSLGLPKVEDLLAAAEPQEIIKPYEELAVEKGTVEDSILELSKVEDLPVVTDDKLMIPTEPKATLEGMEEVSVPVFELKESLPTISEKVWREWLVYKKSKENLEKEIRSLETRNKEINDWTANELDTKRLDTDDDYLKKYGDICREYTLNIQRLRELDAKFARAKVLYDDANSKVMILQSASALGLPLADLAMELEADIDERLEDRQRVKIVFQNKKVKTVDINIDEGRTFANVSFADNELEEDLNSYVQKQRHLLKASKLIEALDDYEIDKAFRLDYLSQYLDFNSLNDAEQKNSLGKKLDQKYFDIHRGMAEKYGILLPTRKAGIPLYFEGKQIRIPSEYLKTLYVYNRENNASLKEKFNLAKMSESDSLILIEAMLYGQIMRDASITPGQLSAIKTRLNAILLTHPQLKTAWLPLKDRDFLRKTYPYFDYSGGWFKDVPLEEIQQRMVGIAENTGIFEYPEVVESEVSPENNQTKQEDQEYIKKIFISKFKAEIAVMKNFSEEDKESYITFLDGYLLELIESAESANDIFDIIQRKRDQYLFTDRDTDTEKDSKNKSYKFYDGLLFWAKKLL